VNKSSFLWCWLRLDRKFREFVWQNSTTSFNRKRQQSSSSSTRAFIRTKPLCCSSNTWNSLCLRTSEPISEHHSKWQEEDPPDLDAQVIKMTRHRQKKTIMSASASHYGWKAVYDPEILFYSSDEKLWQGKTIFCSFCFLYTLVPPTSSNVELSFG
jgi:hypothetical protein